MKIRLLWAGLLLPLLGATAAVAQQKGEAASQQEVQQLRQQLKDLQKSTDEALEDFENRLLELKQGAGGGAFGSTKFVITGYGLAGYDNSEASDSSFNAGFFPIFLWQLSDRAFFEAEVEFELEGSSTEVGLEFAQLSYILHDYVTVSAGKFLNPGNFFMDRLHPAWINKLPDKPLPFGKNKIQASTEVGFHVHGAVPIGTRKAEYALWVSNGPSLNTTDPTKAGMLGFKNFEDVDNKKAFGFRVGVFPIPELELGYSAEFSDAAAPGTTTNDVTVLTQAVDLNYTRDSDLIKGTVDVRFQWVFTNIGTTTFDPTGKLKFGPVTFDNNRNGGYAQVAYRPSKVENDIIKNLEAILRFDALYVPVNAPFNIDQNRVTIGLDYWIAPSLVAKAAVAFNDRSNAKDDNVVLFQAAFGL